MKCKREQLEQTWPLCTVLPEISLNHIENHNIIFYLFSKINFPPFFFFFFFSVEQGHEYVASGSNTIYLTPG
jgi:hypothetical protein